MNYISCLGILWQLRGVGPHPHLLTDCHKAKPELGAGIVQSGGWWIRQWHHLAIIKITLLNDKQSSTEGMLKLRELLTSLGTVFSFDFFRLEPLFSNYIKMELRNNCVQRLTEWDEGGALVVWHVQGRHSSSLFLQKSLVSSVKQKGKNFKTKVISS